MCFPLYCFHLVCHKASTHGGGAAGAAPCSSQAQTFLRPLERGERGGAAAAPAGRELPQEARAARSWMEAKVVLS